MIATREGQLQPDIKPPGWPWSGLQRGPVPSPEGRKTQEVCVFDGVRFRLTPMPTIQWINIAEIDPQSYQCAHCGREIATNKGYRGNGAGPPIHIAVCSNCDLPTILFHDGRQIPGLQFGGVVASLPEEVERAYSEARSCMQISAFTAAGMLCRKVLMHVAVERGAPDGKTFAFYVDYLDTEGYLFKNSKPWVDEIRNMGNDANHDLTVFTGEQAKEAITFTEMLLRMVYEFPAKLKKPEEP